MLIDSLEYLKLLHRESASKRLEILKIVSDETLLIYGEFLTKEYKKTLTKELLQNHSILHSRFKNNAKLYRTPYISTLQNILNTLNPLRASETPSNPLMQKIRSNAHALYLKPNGPGIYMAKSVFDIIIDNVVEPFIDDLMDNYTPVVSYLIITSVIEKKEDDLGKFLDHIPIETTRDNRANVISFKKIYDGTKKIRLISGDYNERMELTAFLHSLLPKIKAIFSSHFEISMSDKQSKLRELSNLPPDRVWRHWPKMLERLQHFKSLLDSNIFIIYGNLQIAIELDIRNKPAHRYAKKCGELFIDILNILHSKSSLNELAHKCDEFAGFEQKIYIESASFHQNITKLKEHYKKSKCLEHLHAAYYRMYREAFKELDFDKMKFASQSLFLGAHYKSHPLLIAIRQGYNEEAKKFLYEDEHNIFIDHQDYYKSTALHLALSKKNITITHAIANHYRGKLNFLIQNRYGDSYLHLAIAAGFNDVARWLINNDFRLLNVINNYGETPLDLAIKFKAKEIYSQLIEIKAKSNCLSSLPYIIHYKLSKKIASYNFAGTFEKLFTNGLTTDEQVLLI